MFPSDFPDIRIVSAFQKIIFERLFLSALFCLIGDAASP